MPENPAALFINAIKKQMRIESDDKLASALGVGKSTLATWRKRGFIPKKTRDAFLVELGIDYDLVTQNVDGINKIIEQQIATSIYLSILRLGSELQSDLHVEYASWLARYDHKVRYLILSHFRNDDIVRASPSEFTEILMRVARGELCTPKEIIALKEAADAQGDP